MWVRRVYNTDDDELASEHDLAGQDQRDLTRRLGFVPSAHASTTAAPSPHQPNQALSTPTTPTIAKWGRFKPSRWGRAKPSLSTIRLPT